ncbi:MAG TPA: glycosyltransferase [Gemmatimonadales bacterium]|nr:glycosyltransferase [Gemmatimonadales bacterium]
MRIAFLVVRFPVAAETPFLNQITGLLDRGHDVRIFADERSRSALEHPDVARHGLVARTSWPERLPKGVLARALAARRALAGRPAPERRLLLRALDPRLGRPARTLNLFAQTLRYLPGARFDVIQGCFGPDGIRAEKLRRIGVLRGPIVTAVRGYDLSKYLRRRGPGAYAALFRAGERFLPVCEALAGRLRSVGCPPERILVHHTGIQLRDHPFRPRALPHGRPLRLVTVGRLVEKKGVAFGLEVVAALAREGRPVEYHVIGDGPLRPALEAQARACPPGAVRFHGARLPDDVRVALDGMDAMLAPHVTAADGDEEGIPNVLKEAMALGLPVITTRHSGIPELVTDGVSGWLAGERDVAGLVRGVLALLEHPERWEPVTAAARAAVERDFDIDRLNDRLVTIYGALAAPSPPETP